MNVAARRSGFQVWLDAPFVLATVIGSSVRTKLLAELIQRILA
jgi:hypothetical protein